MTNHGWYTEVSGYAFRNILATIVVEATFHMMHLISRTCRCMSMNSSIRGKFNCPPKCGSAPTSGCNFFPWSDFNAHDRTGHLFPTSDLMLFTVATESISPSLEIKLSTLHWNLSSIAAGNHYHTIMFYSLLLLSLQLGRLPGIWLPDTKSIWCTTKIKPYIAWK